MAKKRSAVNWTSLPETYCLPPGTSNSNAFPTPMKPSHSNLDRFREPVPTTHRQRLRRLRHRIGCVAVALLGCLTATAKSEIVVIHGRVVGVHDGDTLTLVDHDKIQFKIRVDGIDAPELRQPFGRVAKQGLTDIAAGKDAVASCAKSDRYGRQVCQVHVGDSDVGLAQLRNGLAWMFRRYGHELPTERRRQYSEAEQEAKLTHRGLWTDPPSMFTRTERMRMRAAAQPLDLEQRRRFFQRRLIASTTKGAHRC